MEEWEAKLGSEPTVSLISDTVEAFKAAIDGLGSVAEAAAAEGKAKKAKKDDKQGGGDKGKKAEKAPGSSRFVVRGGQMFNAVVRLCLSKMEPALRKVLRLEKEAPERMKAKKLQKSKKWTACNREGPHSIETLEGNALISHNLREGAIGGVLLLSLNT